MLPRQTASQDVHHLQTGYTACGWDPESMTCTAVWKNVTCKECIRIGPRKVPSRPESELESIYYGR